MAAPIGTVRAARILGVSTQTVHNWADTAGIEPVFKAEGATGAHGWTVEQIDMLAAANDRIPNWDGE